MTQAIESEAKSYGPGECGQVPSRNGLYPPRNHALEREETPVHRPASAGYCALGPLALVVTPCNPAEKKTQQALQLTRSRSWSMHPPSVLALAQRIKDGEHQHCSGGLRCTFLSSCISSVLRKVVIDYSRFSCLQGQSNGCVVHDTHSFFALSCHIASLLS